MRVIAWDMDDVLNDLMRIWFEKKWLPSHPSCKLRYEDLTENPPDRLLKINSDEYLVTLDDFRLSQNGEQIPPVPEVYCWFGKYGERFRHIALTARPIQTVPVAAAWVFRHFGNWIRSFHFIPAKRKGETTSQYDDTKEDFLRWLGKVDILVDDSEPNVKAANKLGINGILMPRPWNKNKMTIAETLEQLK